jgi:hypothetical protein
MLSAILKKLQGGSASVDFSQVMSRTALEFLGRGGMGHSFGPLDDEHASEHSEAVSNVRHVIKNCLLASYDIHAKALVLLSERPQPFIHFCPS